MPKVSVIIPVYGVEKYIERCARSLFEQTLDDIEYLFIDDCTPDKSVEVLKRVLEDYPNRMGQVIIHRMEQNCGQAAVRKWGMQNATGEYVIHCDSDDWVDTSMYEKMYNKAVEESADIVVCDYVEINGQSQKYIRSGHNSSPNYLFEYFQLWIRMIKRDLISKIRYYPSGNMGEDRVYAVQTGWFAHKIARIDDAYYFYFIHEQSICRKCSRDNYIRNFWMRYANVNTIASFVEEERIPNHQEWLILLKWQTLCWLAPFIREKEILKLWKRTFPELHKQMLYARKISFKEKLMYYICFSGILTIPRF